MLFDAHQRYTRAGLQVFLRVKNYQDRGDFAEVGVPFVPTGTLAADTGFVDIPIDPPPAVEEAHMRNVGLLAARLNFGSRVFIISNTFVASQLNLSNMVAAGVKDPYDVFRTRDGNAAIGIFYNNRLFSIESITHKDVSGQTLSWEIVGNAMEPQTTVVGGPS